MSKIVNPTSGTGFKVRPVSRALALVACTFGVIYKKNHCLIQGHEALQLCFIVLALSFRSLIPFELILYVVYTRDSTSFFDCGWPVVLSHLLKILFLPLLNCHVSLVKNQLTKKKKKSTDQKCMGFWGFLTLNSIPLIYTSQYLVFNVCHS